MIIETYPSPGEPLQEKIISQYGYYNLYRKANINTGNWSRDCGWEATGKSVMHLWTKTKSLISFHHPKTSRVKVVIKSKWLVEELKHCEEDEQKMTAKAEYGYHDDRLRGAQLALLAIHNWRNDTLYVNERADSEAEKKNKAVDYQATDMTYAEMQEAIEEKLNPTW
jgi:hypothetical protein